MVATAQTIPGLLRSSATDFADQFAIVDRGRRWTYPQLEEEVRAAAKACVTAGLQHGDRMALWCPNRWEFIVAALGAQYVGGVMVPLNTRYRGAEAADIIGRSRARLLVVANGFLSADYLGMLRLAAAADASADVAADGTPVPGLPHLEGVIDIEGSAGGPGVTSWADFVAAGAAIDDATLDARAAAVTADDVADMYFTSGTTGKPKGAMSAQRQTIKSGAVWAERGGVTVGDRYAIVNPFFHTFGSKAGYMASIVVGATMYPVAKLDVGELVQLVYDERITILPGAPTLFTTIMEHLSRAGADLSSLRWSVTGAAVVPESLIRRMIDELGFDHVVQAYGMTECVMISMSLPDDPPEVVQVSAGHPFDGVEVRIVNDEGADAADDEKGEVWVRSDTVMLGYFEDPEATARAIDAEGWFHTGDIGYRNGHGIRITDRLKDMFTVGGFNVYPAEVEHTLTAHDSVSEAAVVGIPDDRMGEVPLAYVVRRRDSPLSTDDLATWCKERLANFKVPRRIKFVDELPKNAAGKVLKTTLREH